MAEPVALVMRSPTGRALAATALAVVAVALWPASALGTVPSCGDVITKDTKLKKDILDCAGDGLTIAADGVTLDLGGHVIDGDGDGGSGIISYGNHRVQIRNGTVRQFRIGVYLTRSLAPTVAASTLPTNHLVTKLTVVDNANHGIHVLDGSQNVLERNRIARNGAWGISIAGGGDNTIARSTLVGNRSGGLLLSSGTRLNSTHDNLVRENEVADNEGYGIVLGGSLLAPFSIRDNQIEKNDVIGNERDGIWLAGGGGTLEGNRTDRNGDDGIDVDCRYRADAPPDARTCLPETTLRRNAANRNGDLGIEADPGITDGGRNTGTGNGTPAECVGVTCS